MEPRQSISQEKYVIKNEHLHSVVKGLIEDHLHAKREDHELGELSISIGAARTATESRAASKQFFLSQIAANIGKGVLIAKEHEHKYTQPNVLNLVYSHVSVTRNGDLVLSREGEARTAWDRFVRRVRPKATWKSHLK